MTDVQSIQHIASERKTPMIYGLWDTETNNLVGDFDNQRDALAVVLRAIERNGPHDTDTLALDVEDVHGEGHLIASGQELAELARREFAAKRIAG